MCGAGCAVISIPPVRSGTANSDRSLAPERQWRVSCLWRFSVGSTYAANLHQTSPSLDSDRVPTADFAYRISRMGAISLNRHSVHLRRARPRPANQAKLGANVEPGKTSSLRGCQQIFKGLVPAAIAHHPTHRRWVGTIADGGSTVSLANFDVDRALARLTMMERIRAFEEAARRAAVDDELVLGAIHLSIGQEAVATGVIEPLRRDDYITSTHRGHGHTLAKGADPAAMMKELLGREGGCCGGKGGSMHIADFGVGMLGANGVVAANITIAAGAAHGVKLLGGDQVTVCFFGDGAANRGPFLEGLNWSGVFELPILFVCEDNRYSASTLTSMMTSGRGVDARAQSLGLRAAVVDGNDVTALAEYAAEAVARIRATQTPEFLHAVTYRLDGHTYFDPAAYRPAGEATREAATNCPIRRQRAALVAAGVTETDLDAIADQAATEMMAALDAAKAAPWPADDTVFGDVQDIGSPAREAF